LSLSLLALLGLLFTALSLAVLGDVRLALLGVAGALVALGLLALAFATVGYLVGLLPVPEHVGRPQLLVLTPVLLAALLVTYLLPAVGVLLLLLALTGGLLMLTPTSWKATTRLGLRGIGRQPTRTATTLVALFIGVFCVGLIVVLGIDIRGKLDQALSNQASYNLLAFESVRSGDHVGPALESLPGVQGRRRFVTMSVSPVAVKGQPVAAFLLGGKPGRHRPRPRTAPGGRHGPGPAAAGAQDGPAVDGRRQRHRQRHRRRRAAVGSLEPAAR
jgi:hypothetical protein